MSRISRSALVPYAPDQMYQLVNAIEAYPEFLPWCAGAVEISRNVDRVVGQVDLALGRLKHSFVTENRLEPVSRIDISLVRGPFSTLEGHWAFEEPADRAGTACLVKLDLEYHISNPLLRVTLGPVFNKVAETLVYSFQKRAETVYGLR